MEYVKFGHTGMDVSRICLGAMGFGDAEKWTHKWVLDEENSRPVIKKALDLGINFFDTANIYSMGESEKILGRALKDYAKRDDIVLATKVHQTMRPGRPNSGGLSRKEIMNEIDQSLERLGTDYVDLYIIHRWDYNTPIEETMEALHEVVKSGKARYIGASAMYAWQFQKAQNVAKSHGWTKFVSMQNHYNMIYREEEREMIPFCKDEKIALTPYSPLASGILTRDWSETTFRSETDQVQHSKYSAMKEVDRGIVERVAELATNHGTTRDKIALAWILNKDQVVSPIIGAQKEKHLESAVGALDIQLTQDEMNYLEELYIPHPVVGALPNPN
ncbi:aldo/keto reductase [Alkalicoccobacillus murimartini]|uniref:Aryl-alcohol dehydrogenase-like predicted oxidoreductase n=1 Tax=Alkalicoccobacillus murimartini TaxID=171685 RepID=A0ABT9YNV5_9BACI|nr:aldo/keto reductase [Alkalicoccobacillus murimartini]MDQ0208709.1 aryl-alcohol dehydrogenase-like predicted oxidoreductase [Alkalicoccobacillus murimartini]